MDSVLNSTIATATSLTQAWASSLYFCCSLYPLKCAGDINVVNIHTVINSDVTVYCVVPTGTLTMRVPLTTGLGYCTV